MPIIPTGQFKQSLDSFYVTDSPLSITNIAEMAMFYIKLTSLSDFSLEDVPISLTGQFKQSLDNFYVTDSPLSVTNIAEMFYIKLTSLSDFSLEDGPISPTGQFKQSLDSFYVTDSPLSVTNIAEMQCFIYENCPVLVIFPYRKWQLVQLVSLN